MIKMTKGNEEIYLFTEIMVFVNREPGRDYTETAENYGVMVHGRYLDTPGQAVDHLLEEGYLIA